MRAADHAEDLERALEIQKESGEKIGKILVDGLVAHRDMLAACPSSCGSAGQHRRAACRFSGNGEALPAIPAAVPLPSRRDAGFTLTLAMADPLDFETLAAVRRFTG